MIKKIKEQQPIFYQLISNAFKQNRKSHAYLLIGEHPQLSVDFLMMSILCDEQLACGQCINCQKVKNRKHSDIIEFDGNIESIKKKHIEEIQDKFIQSSFEGKSRIYIIHHIEKSSKEAMNALLKMLEEPEGDIVAIFTSNNKNRILPTIISRCQTIELKPDNHDVLKQRLIENDVEEMNARILSKLHTIYNEAIESNNEQLDYTILQVMNMMEDISTKPLNTLINFQTNYLKKYKEKKDIRLFLNLLVLAYKDMFHVKHFPEKVCFINYMDFLRNIEYNEEDIINKIRVITEYNYKIESNANIMLLMDSLIYTLQKGKI